MRVALVGPERERDRLRWQLEGTGITVVGEYASEEAARRSGVSAEAWLVTTVGRSTLDASDGDPDVDPLTAREVDVLELLAEGLPNKAIAERLGISDQTVKFHVASITGKLGVANRTGAVRAAVRRGLLTM
jgi:DNA-binding NarL/FixJ family response regulator